MRWAKLMNAAEEIVKFWLESKRFFMQSSIALPNRKELDILAINQKGEKWHVEVSVSINSINSLSAKELASKECTRKFQTVASEVEAKFGKNYKKIYVRGRISQGRRDIRDAYAKECKVFGVEVVKFENVINDVAPLLLSRNYLNPVVKTFQLINVFANKKI